MSCLKTPKEILGKIIDANLAKVQKPFRYNFIFGIFGGVFIAIAGMFYIVVTSGNTEMFLGAKKFMGAIAFCTGFVLVLIMGGDLYTSSVMMITNVMRKNIALFTYVKCLILVYIANIVGALLFLALVLSGGFHLMSDGQVAKTILSIGVGKMSHGFMQAFMLGIACNFLVCLAYWGTQASNTATGKIFTLMFPIGAFVVAGFEHSVANMFLLPLALTTKELIPADMLASLGSDYDVVNVKNALLYNLLPVTLGNFVGGAFLVGVPYAIALKEEG